MLPIGGENSLYQTQKIDSSVQTRLLHFMETTGYTVIQENGQRRTTSPDYKSEAQRLTGAEVFLGRLPRDCYEFEILPLAQRVGKVLELRLMLDFSGTTRGYGFVLYESAAVAQRACRHLNNQEIRRGHSIGVVKSVDNRRLFFGGVPKDKSKEEFTKELSGILDGIVQIYMYPNPEDHTLNRGFIFVEFKDHRSAAMARRKLIPGKICLWGHEIAVDWADPEPGDPINDEVMLSVTALFIRNIQANVTQQRLKEILQKETREPIVKLKKMSHFAFVHYDTRELAQKVYDILTDKYLMDKYGWEVQWAKPISVTKSAERQRCIIEAFSGMSLKDEPSESKQQAAGSSSSSRRRQKKTATVLPIPRDNDNVSPTSSLTDFKFECQEFLEDLVGQHFGAQCLFNCLKVKEHPRRLFICEITLVKNGYRLYSQRGEEVNSKQKAISSACKILLESLFRTSRDGSPQQATKIPRPIVQQPLPPMNDIFMPNSSQPGLLSPCQIDANAFFKPVTNQPYVSV